MSTADGGMGSPREGAHCGDGACCADTPGWRSWSGQRRVYLSAAGPTAPPTRASPLRGLSSSSADWSPTGAR